MLLDGHFAVEPRSFINEKIARASPLLWRFIFLRPLSVHFRPESRFAFANGVPMVLAQPKSTEAAFG